jgi:hypothetical protein
MAQASHANNPTRRQRDASDCAEQVGQARHARDAQVPRLRGRVIVAREPPAAAAKGLCTARARGAHALCPHCSSLLLAGAPSGSECAVQRQQHACSVRACAAQQRQRRGTRGGVQCQARTDVAVGRFVRALAAVCAFSLRLRFAFVTLGMSALQQRKLCGSRHAQERKRVRAAAGKHNEQRSHETEQQRVLCYGIASTAGATSRVAGGQECGEEGGRRVLLSGVVALPPRALMTTCAC